MYQSRFKKQIDIKDRKKMFSVFKHKYPDKIPLIIESANDNYTENINLKIGMKPNLRVCQLLYTIRKEAKLSERESYYIYANKKIVPNNRFIKNIYKEFKDDDGFLYLGVMKLPTFGGLE